MKFWSVVTKLFEKCSKAKKIALGAGLGVFLSIGLLALGIRSPKNGGVAPSSVDGQNLLRASDVSTLGLSFENIPSISLKPMSFDEISRRIGLTDADRGVKEALALAERVRGGYLPSGWDTECASQYSSHFCNIVNDYLPAHKKRATLESADDQGEERPKFVVEKVRRRGPKFPFTKKYVSKLQLEDLNQQLRRAPDWTFSQMRSLADGALLVKSCPRNLSLTLARKMDLHLSERGAWELMDRLDAHGMECLQRDDPWAEMIYQRVGMYALARKLNKEAAGFLEKAQQAETKREEYRSLYWLSFAREKMGLEKEARAAREALWRAYPLSWHTIVSRVRHGIDPLQVLKANSIYSDEYESGKKQLDQRSYWLQLMMQSDVLPFSVRHYGEFVVKTFTPDINPGFVQHLARIFNNNGLHRLQIMVLSQMISSKPDAVNVESLRLLYPRPYFEELQAEGRLDTAILLGLARQESGFDPNAVSSANARGLLQLLPSTARSLKGGRTRKLHDYSDNIALGSQYLVKLAKGFDGSIERTLASYNAGATVVRKWINRYSFVNDFEDPMLALDMIPYRETRDYVPSILRNAYWYHRLFPELTEKLGPQVITSEFLRATLNPGSK